MEFSVPELSTIVEFSGRVNSVVGGWWWCLVSTVVVIENCRPELSTIMEFSVGGVRVCIVCVPELSTMVEFSDGDVCVQSWNISRCAPLSHHHSNTTARSQ